MEIYGRKFETRSGIKDFQIDPREFLPSQLLFFLQM